MADRRFFLSRDHSGHWYVIENRHRSDWFAWLQLDENDEASWTPPDFARRVNGSEEGVTFTNPKANYV